MKNSVQTFVVHYLMHHDGLTRSEAVNALRRMKECILKGIPVEDVFFDAMIGWDEVPYDPDFVACHLTA